MNDHNPPRWFWALSGLAVIWNLLGIAAYVADVTMSAEALAQLPAAERDLREAVPGWVTGAYAVAVFTGTAAAIVLCLRRRLAIALFVVSLAAVVLQMGYLFGVADAAAVLGAGALIGPGIIILLAALQVWFAVISKNRHWLA